MQQKHLIILFLVIAAIGLGITGINSFKEGENMSAVPSPAPENLIFNAGQASDVQGIQSMPTTKPNSQIQYQPTLQPSPQPTQKAVKQYRQFPGVLADGELRGKKAVIETNKGKIELEIYPEATKAASNFIFLAKDGFYDGLSFHRVVPNFVIQGGDPLGNGAGGPGYKFEDEPVTRKYDKGIVAMANAGPNTNGSQFFIMLADNPNLPPQYTIFGKVTIGQDIVEKIAVGDIMQKITIMPIN